MEQFLWLIPLGFFAGTVGTLIGAGGGFIMIPILLLLYPDKSPETITSISMAVVFVNAMSGSFSYAKMKKIDYKSGLLFAAITLPGTILGSITIAYIPRNLFNGIFGILLIILAIYLNIKPENKTKSDIEVKKGYLTRTLTDIDNITYKYSFNPKIGIFISIFVGYISSFLGIGGGIIHVPVFIHLLNFPVHIATATSHFMLSIMAFSSTTVHFISGTLSDGVIQIIGLAIGVLFGAQLGAKLSKKLRGVYIIRGLSIALGLVGIRVLLSMFL